MMLSITSQKTTSYPDLCYSGLAGIREKLASAYEELGDESSSNVAGTEMYGFKLFLLFRHGEVRRYVSYV